MANLVVYDTTEVCSADTLPWLEVGLWQSPMLEGCSCKLNLKIVH
jgi:hypothetical protein